MKAFCVWFSRSTSRTNYGRCHILSPHGVFLNDVLALSMPIPIAMALRCRAFSQTNQQDFTKALDTEATFSGPASTFARNYIQRLNSDRCRPSSQRWRAPLRRCWCAEPLFNKCGLFNTSRSLLSDHQGTFGHLTQNLWTQAVEELVFNSRVPMRLQF